MYAEERQQAIAGLVTRNRRVSVSQAAKPSVSPRRPCGATSRSSSNRALVRRVHGVRLRTR